MNEEHYEDGFYWCNDKSRYGWEVIWIVNDRVFQPGVALSIHIDHFQPAKQNNLIKIVPPTS